MSRPGSFRAPQLLTRRASRRGKVMCEVVRRFVLLLAMSHDRLGLPPQLQHCWDSSTVVVSRGTHLLHLSPALLGGPSG